MVKLEYGKVIWKDRQGYLMEGNDDLILLWQNHKGTCFSKMTGIPIKKSKKLSSFVHGIHLVIDPEKTRYKDPFDRIDNWMLGIEERTDLPKERFIELERIGLQYLKDQI